VISAVELLAGRYRLEERIAVGGMGEVWRAEDTLLGRTVAVKCLKPEYVGDAEFSARFRAEARHAAGLSHPGIASVYDYGEQTEPEPAAWLVMELVAGEPLSALLRRDGALPVDRALDVVGQAALALEAAHTAGVVHRDVKPGNLLVRPDGVVKVTDFGIARATDAVPITRTGTVVGTAFYLSPEQASGGVVTPASDVYSLGVVAYECLTGARPFPGDNPVAVASAHLHQSPPPLPDHLPEPVRALVASALAKDPADRPAHAGELGRTALALRAELAESTTTVLPVDGGADPATTRVLPVADAPAVPPRRRSLPAPARNHQRTVRLAAAMLALVLLALAIRSWSGAGEPTPAPRASASTAASAPTRVTVVASAYLGRPAAEVRAALVALGLKPSYAYDGAGGPAGTVRGVSPTGALAPGSAVTISVVPAPSPEPAKDAGSDAGKPGRGKKK
jgi:serine/threonine-protein kinase